MKPLAIWAAGVLVTFGALAGVTTATRDTEQVFVVVDTSFFMDDVSNRIPGALERIEERDYSEFALAVISDRAAATVHGYQSDIDWPGGDAFGPCSFDEIERFPEASSADERILVTSNASCSTGDLDAWTIIEIEL